MRLKPELGIMIKIALAVGTFLTSYGIGARRLAAQRCPRRFVPLITENLDRCK